MRKVNLTDIQGVLVCTGKKSTDHRGAFTKFYERGTRQYSGFDPKFNSLAIASNVEAGTIRGLHFQSPPFEEEKLIVCLQGRVFDVIVDLRENSQTLGKWAAIELSDSEPLTLSLPKGIAHGYQTLAPETNVFYGLTSEFNEGGAHSLDYADADLDIKWPLPVNQISAKDSNGISLQQAIDLAAGRSVL